MSYRKWGMSFDSAEDCPDFGSIYLTELATSGVNSYQLYSKDVSKLNLLTNAASGSTALCIDTADLYVLDGDRKWVIVGGN